MTKRTALVTGATGLVSGYLLAHLLEEGDWDIVTVSRGSIEGLPSELCGRR